MTEYYELALAFSRECLKLEEPTISGGGNVIAWRHRGEWETFRHRDLNTIMRLVRVWCETLLPNFYCLSTAYYKPDPADDTWIVEIQTRRDTFRACNPNLCHALLDACLQAQRRLDRAQASSPFPSGGSTSIQ